MGLLDEAIREHLELKRRGGADPTAVERAEREALEPGFIDDQALAEGPMEDPLDQPPLEAEPVASAPIEAPFEPFEHHQSPDATLADFSSVGQDTAELDMRSVFGEDIDGQQPAPPFAAVKDGAQAAYAGAAPVEEALEYDAVGDPGEEPSPEVIPGQERLAFE